MSSSIKVVNNTPKDITVSITTTGSDSGKGGSESWYTISSNGGSDTWNYRTQHQIVRFARGTDAGFPVESVLGVPGATVTIS